MNAWLLILSGWGAISAGMAALWMIQRWHGDAGIVDVAWGLGVGVLGAVFAACSESGDPTRRAVIGSLALIWSLRLSGYIFARLMRLPEDGRYQTLKSQWGPRAQFNLFVFFQMQALWSVLFALPMLVAARNPSPAFNLLDGLAVVLWLIAVGGETLADRQLSVFRRDPTNQGKVCRNGLWYYSRHPNYFFEWVHWWVYVLFAIGAPFGWLTLFGPALMLFFLFKVTGIPPTEAQAIKSRGAAYREYQQTTSPFFPWPPRRRAV